MSVDVGNVKIARLLGALGTPYYWGRGMLATPWDEMVEGGTDCSGLAQVALRELWIVRPDAWADKSAHDLANACDPVSGEVELGDLAFYGESNITHVTVCIGGGMCIGANGGGRTTKGDNPLACVQARPIGYRGDLVVVGRLKAQFSRST